MKQWMNKDVLKQRAQTVWIKAQAQWVVWQPKLLPHWLKFKAFNEKLFALSDHSSLRKSRIMLRVTAVLLGLLFHNLSAGPHLQDQISQLIRLTTHLRYSPN